MRDQLFELEIEEFPIGKAVRTFVDFPSFYGLQKVLAPVYIYRATKKVSPCLVVTACIHGDETNGLRICQTLMNTKFKLIKGTLIIIPTVNIYGFLNKQRYLPDRKDLNRCFPGSRRGSFGSRFANFILNRITKYGDYFIDLHSGGPGRFNIPQIRCDLGMKQNINFIEAASIPLIVNSTLRDGSLRAALTELDKPCIVFEGGEGLRIDEVITKYGVNLVKSLMAHLGMIKNKSRFKKEKLIIHKTKWIRAREGGIFISKSQQGKIVKKGEVVGELRELSGKLINKITMEDNGVVLGMNQHALIMAGDALFNIGFTDIHTTEDVEDFGDFFDFEM